tara:strand:- start:1188 stop:2180 length:993 start_codon:yes stop_codon:yes gene_type:complete
LLKAGDFDGIKYLVESALKAGNDKNVGHEYNKDIESRFREDSRTTIATPWDKVNDVLQGGLGNGDFGLIFGNPGGGKSWSLVALGGYAVRMGFNVLHYTLELGEQYVGRRYDAFFSNIPVDQVLQNREKIEEILPQLPGELIIKEFPTGRATISTIESHIRKVGDLGTKADLIIIDYVDLLSTKKRTADRKGEIDDIYTSTKGLARELDLPIWSVSQVNRAGAKDNVIEGDKAAGSYDKMMITDFCMSLSRKAKDKVNGTGRFHIMKNRYGMDGLTFGVKADTSTGHFEVHDYNEDDYESDDQPTQNKSYDNFDSFDKQVLKNKFFELNA